MDPHDHYIQEEVQYDIDHDLNSAPLGSGCNALFDGNDIDDTVFLAADRPDSPSLIWMDMIQDLTDLPSPGTYINTNSHPATDHHLHAVASNDHGLISRYTANLECLSPDRFATDLPLSPLWFYQSANSTPAAGATTGSSVLPQGTAKCSNNSAKKPYYTRPPATSGLHKASSEPNIRRSSNLGIRPVAAVHQPAPDADYADHQIRNTRNIFLDNHLSDDLSDSNSFTNLSCSFPGSSDHYLQGFDQSAALQLGLEDMLMLHGQSSGGGDSVLDHLSVSRSDNYMSRSYTALPAPRLQKRNAQAEPQEDSGLRLVHMLLACAEAVARDDHVVAEATLIQLQRLVSKTGNSMQRVAAYFTAALHARLTNTGGRSYAALVSSLHDPSTADEVVEAYQVLYQACPYIKFAHFTCNQAIYEAFEGEERVHIVDLDIMQGYQWPAFIQALAARPGGAPHLRITGVGMPLELVQETGRRLGELAELVHLPFEFHAVGEKLEDLRAHMLQRRVGEALAVNSITRLHRLFSQASYSKSLPNLLHMLWQQAPHVLTLVEQEASHNGPFFLSRFLEALHYYSAIFDSLDATLPQNSPERAKVEQLLFAQEIVNIVACEDLQRIERHEKLEKWRKIMEATGFKSIPLSANAINQSKILLGLYPCSGYMLTEDKGALQLGWQERLILGVSAWSC